MTGDARPERTIETGWRRPVFRWGVLFVVLFAFWVALSGHLSREFLVLGALSAAMATLLTVRLYQPHDQTIAGHDFPPLPNSFFWLGKTAIRFAAYLPWLMWEVLMSNLHVAYIVLHPRLPIDPSLVQFISPLTMEPAQVLLAQSITLTPGTVTLDLSRGRFLVHCLSVRSKRGLGEGGLQRRIGRVFGEGLHPPPEVTEVTTAGEVQW